MSHYAIASHTKPMSSNPAPYPPEFEFLWEQFPRKVEKYPAFHVWQRLSPKPDLFVVVAAVWIVTRGEWLPSIRKARDAGERNPMLYVPHPRKFLHGRRWEDYSDSDLAAGIAEAKTAFEEWKNPSPPPTPDVAFPYKREGESMEVYMARIRAEAREEAKEKR